MKNALLIPAILAAFMLGCAHTTPTGAGAGAEAEVGEALPEIVVGNDQDLEALWQAAIQVVGARFAIAQTDPAARVIETEWLVGAPSQTGFKYNAATPRDAAAETLHTIRRRATVTVYGAAECPVSIVIPRQRLVRVHPDAVASGKYSLEEPINTAKDAASAAWVDDGRDGALEEKIYAEIADAYMKIVTGQEPAALSPAPPAPVAPVAPEAAPVEPATAPEIIPEMSPATPVEPEVEAVPAPEAAPVPEASAPEAVMPCCPSTASDVAPVAPAPAPVAPPAPDAPPAQ